MYGWCMSNKIKSFLEFNNELCSLLEIECNKNNLFPDLSSDNNFENLKQVFDKWSTPFKFIKRGEYYNGILTNYWAHQSRENYIIWLSVSLKQVLPVCLNNTKNVAKKLIWSMNK